MKQGGRFWGQGEVRALSMMPALFWDWAKNDGWFGKSGGGDAHERNIHNARAIEDCLIASITLLPEPGRGKNGLRPAEKGTSSRMKKPVPSFTKKRTGFF
jgi:hypothetical protein